MQNGDNIKLENCNGSNLNTFWSAGQTQSRDNSIQNIYVLHINTLVIGTQIGQQYGTPPALHNVSVAGFCKQIISMSTGFSSFSVHQFYFESLWSIGQCNANFVSFIQSQIKFHPPTNGVTIPLKHLSTNAVVSFQDCDIAYFSNCLYKIPFMFESQHVNITGGQVEGGIILPGILSNADGERIHNIFYNNVKMKCFNSNISKDYSDVIKENMKNIVVIGGARIRTHSNEEFVTKGNTYNLQYIENNITIKIEKGKAFFKSNNSFKYQVGDNLLTGTSIVQKSSEQFRPALGYVSEIMGDLVYILGCPEEAVVKNIDIYSVGFFKFLDTNLK